MRIGTVCGAIKTLVDRIESELVDDLSVVCDRRVSPVVYWQYRCDVSITSACIRYFTDC